MKICWHPRVRPERIYQVYQDFARGSLDPTAVDDLGLALLLRCESILRVSQRELECPLCGTVFSLANAADPDQSVGCPGKDCSFRVTLQEYQASWSKRYLNGANALPAFEEFSRAYPKARSVEQKLRAIDTVIHAFHWDMKINLPNRSAANNLIEANHDQALELLDSLSFGPGQTKERWRQTVAAMRRRRRGE